MAQLFSILRRNHQCADELALAKALAKAFGGTAIEVRKQMAVRRGVVAEGLTDDAADSLHRLCTSIGMDVVTLPMESRVTLPEAIELRQVTPDDEGLHIVHEAIRGIRRPPETLDWDDFVWLDLLPVRRTVEKEVRELDLVPIGREGEGTRLGMTTQKVEEDERTQFLEFVVRQPHGFNYWRVEATRCRYRETGLRLQPSTAKNIEILGIAMATRAANAALGSGLLWIRQGTREQFAPFHEDSCHDWAECQISITLSEE